MGKRNIQRNYQDLERIYRSEGGGKMETVFEQRTSHSWRRLTFFLFILLVAASAAAWLGFYAFRTLQQNNGGAVTLQIIAPTEASVGSAVTYRFLVNNKASDVVNNVNLRVNYPSGFLWHASSITPDGESKNTWSLAAIQPGESKEVDVDGTLLGEAGSLGTVFGTLTYKLANFQSELQTSDSVSTALTTGNQTLSWEGDAQAVPGTEVTYVLHYANKSNEPLPPAVLRINNVDGFSVTSTDPKVDATSDGVSWNIDALPPAAEGKVSLIGKWNNTTVGEHALTATLEVAGDQGKTNVITSAELKVTAVGGEALLSLTVNGQQNQPVASLGDTLHLNLHYQNISDVSLGNATVSVSFDSSVINWPEVNLSDGSVDGSSTVWTSKDLPILARIVPGGGGDISWDMPLKNQVSVGTNLSLTVTPTLHYEKRDNDVKPNDIEGAPVIIAVNTGLNLDASARYFLSDGTPVGSGPLPPRVGSETSYQITWKLSSSVHTLTSVIVTGNLPTNVKIGSGSASVGTWQNNNGQPEWHITSLPPGLEPEAHFTVTLRPVSADAGKILILAGKNALTANDDVTKGQVSIAGNTVTTNLDGDTVASGKGIVAAGTP
ncbi:MAG: hypothetical protein WC817_02835 [Patescibacteria group bacterium]|jgi:hypothetical protein